MKKQVVLEEAEYEALLKKAEEAVLVKSLIAERDEALRDKAMADFACRLLEAELAKERLESSNAMIERDKWKVENADLHRKLDAAHGDLNRLTRELAHARSMMWAEIRVSPEAAKVFHEDMEMRKQFASLKEHARQQTLENAGLKAENAELQKAKEAWELGCADAYTFALDSQRNCLVNPYLERRLKELLPGCKSFDDIFDWITDAKVLMRDGEALVDRGVG